MEYALGIFLFGDNVVYGIGRPIRAFGITRNVDAVEVLVCAAPEEHGTSFPCVEFGSESVKEVRMRWCSTPPGPTMERSTGIARSINLADYVGTLLGAPDGHFVRARVIQTRGGGKPFYQRDNVLPTLGITPIQFFSLECDGVYWSAEPAYDGVCPDEKPEKSCCRHNMDRGVGLGKGGASVRMLTRISRMSFRPCLGDARGGKPYLSGRCWFSEIMV